MPAIRSNPGAIDPTSFNQIPKIPKDSLGSWHILPHDFMVDFMEKFMCFFSWPLKIHQLRTSQEKRGLFDSVFFRRVRNWDLQISSFFRSYDYLGNIQITYLEKVANYEEIDMLVSSGLKSNEVQERNLILSGNPIGSGTYI